MGHSNIEFHGASSVAKIAADEIEIVIENLIGNAVRFSPPKSAIVVSVQYALGVTTLLWVVPVGLATAHQAVAVLLLTTTLVLRHAVRSVPRKAEAFYASVTIPVATRPYGA